MDNPSPSLQDTEQISYKEIKKQAEKLSSSNKILSQEEIQTLRIEFEGKKLETELYGQKQFLELQISWAGHIKWQIWAVLGFQFLFVIAMGFNLGNFTNNINKLPYMYVGVILQSLANIIALGFVVAKFLFPYNKKI